MSPLDWDVEQWIAAAFVVVVALMCAGML